MFGLKIIRKTEYEAMKTREEFARERIGELSKQLYQLQGRYSQLEAEHIRWTDRDPQTGRFVRNEDDDNAG